MKTTSSICAYCGCGCRLAFQVEAGRLIKTRPVRDDPASQGSPCIKGLTLHETIHRNRVLRPEIRSSKEEPFRGAEWKEALAFVNQRLRELDPRDVFVVPSGKIPNEDNYVLQKFARIVLRTNNIDSCCTRLCHAPTVRALMEVTGLGASEGVMDDVSRCDVVLIVGTNPASNYPVLFHRLVRAKKASTKILSIQTVYNDTAKYADVALTIRPGTEVVLFNAMMNRLIEEGLYDPEAPAVEGFDRLQGVVRQYDLSVASSVCGLPPEDIQAALEVLSSAKRLGVMHGMGMTQHRNAMPNLYALLNLMILKAGKLLSNRGEANVQGVGDMGCQPDWLPSGPMISLDRLGKEWGVPALPSFQGKTILEAFLISPVKAALLSNFNPAQSLPDLDRVHENLRRMFLVVMESHRSLTSEFADVILPVPSLLERVGTVTTGERRVRPVGRVLEPLGEARPEWKILGELASMAGHQDSFNYSTEMDITKELVSVIPAYSEVNVESLYQGVDQWADKRVRFRRFNPIHFRGTEENPSDRYPFVLVSFRSPYHFLTNEMTSQSETLSKFGEGPFVYLNSATASKKGIQEGDRVRLTSRVAFLDGTARISPKLPEGLIGLHFHFRELLLNRLIPLDFDPETFTPNYKAVAVEVVRLNAPQAPAGPGGC